jgi:uncharacterized protein (UPF0261 family)
MSRRTTAERAIVPVSTVLITLAMMVLVGTTVTDQNAQRQHWLLMIALGGVVVLCVVAASRHLSAARGVRHELTGGEQYRLLAEEYRRLSDLAVTAQEHADLKLGEVTAQLDHMQAQMDSLQRILKEVE